MANCSDVPKLMVIAGPNGAGKSTLLNSLRRNYQEQVIYIGPHRNARRQMVRWRDLLSSPISIQRLMAGHDVPGYEGIALVSGERDPWGFDDIANYLKHALCQVEMERKEAIARRYDLDNGIAPGSLPDPWSPLRELTSNLLPHLKFYKIDATDLSQVRVMWQVHNTNAIVDVDDLSSGEKSVIQMFYPLIESEIKAIISQIQKSELLPEPLETCILIDEPELHLHPNLQAKVLDYLRMLTACSKLQAIIATHSPTIVETAAFEELYLLRPTEAVPDGENQLVQVATDDEKLSFLRDTLGCTANLTYMQSIVVVEGIHEGSGSKTVSDRKLLRAMHPGFDRITVISGGGKAEAIKLRASIAKILEAYSKELRAVALVDRDLSSKEPPEGVVWLPVSMIENFFLDAECIWAALQSVVEKTGLNSPACVERSITSLLDSHTPQEVDRRTRELLGTSYYRPSGSIDGIPEQADVFAQQVRDKYSREKIQQFTMIASLQVDELLSRQMRREFFHGKRIFDGFYAEHVHSTGMSKTIFWFETARHSARRRLVSEFFDGFFADYFPVFTDI